MVRAIWKDWARGRRKASSTAENATRLQGPPLRASAHPPGGIAAAALACVHRRARETGRRGGSEGPTNGLKAGGPKLNVLFIGPPSTANSRRRPPNPHVFPTFGAQLNCMHGSAHACRRHCRLRNDGSLRPGRSKPVVCSRVRRRVRSCISLRLSAGCAALWSRGGSVGARRGQTLAPQNSTGVRLYRRIKRSRRGFR